MPSYQCIVSDCKGKKSTVLESAVNEQELIISICGSGKYLLSHKKVEETDFQKIRRSFNREVILSFTNIMANLLSAGLTVQSALILVRSIAPNSAESRLAKTLAKGMNRGMAFHDVLKQHSSSFSSLYRAMVELGEKTGSVGAVFTRMGAYLESEKKILGKLGNILWYPLLVLFLAIIGCFGILFYVMPKMADIFSAFNAGTARSSMEMEKIYHSLGISLAAAVFLSIVILFTVIFRRFSKAFAYFIDKTLLSLPLAGPFFQALQTLEFSFAMEMLTGAGLTVGNALKESSGVVSNKAYSAAILSTHKKLLNGEKLSSAFLDSKIFPEYIGTWIAVGEKTGEAELVFSRIRSFFQSEVEHGSGRLMGLIEPALTLLIGIIVLFLVVQFVLPVFSLYGRIL